MNLDAGSVSVLQTIVTRPAEPRGAQSRVSSTAVGARFGEILEEPELLDPFEAAITKPGRLR